MVGMVLGEDGREFRLLSHCVSMDTWAEPGWTAGVGNPKPGKCIPKL
jgi:hypothetical protein